MIWGTLGSGGGGDSLPSAEALNPLDEKHYADSLRGYRYARLDYSLCALRPSLSVLSLELFQQQRTHNLAPLPFAMASCKVSSSMLAAAESLKGLSFQSWLFAKKSGICGCSGGSWQTSLWTLIFQYPMSKSTLLILRLSKDECLRYKAARWVAAVLDVDRNKWHVPTLPHAIPPGAQPLWYDNRLLFVGGKSPDDQDVCWRFSEDEGDVVEAVEPLPQRRDHR